MYTEYKPVFTQEKPYYSFSDYVKNRFQTSVGKITINAGFGCKHKREFGGCYFCNLDAYTPKTALNEISFVEQWKRGLARQKRYTSFYAYFQVGTNTPGDVNSLEKMLRSMLKIENVAGFMIGTRVDSLSSEVISFLSEIASEKELWLELGLQSTNNHILERVNRGHTYEEFVETIQAIEAAGRIHTACHMIMGLPGESKEEMLGGVERISTLPLSAVKFHHLQIVIDARFEKQHRENSFPLFSASEYSAFMAEALARLNPRFVVERLVGETPPQYLIAPKWEQAKQDVIEMIRSNMAIKGLYQGSHYKESIPESQTI